MKKIVTLTTVFLVMLILLAASTPIAAQEVPTMDPASVLKAVYAAVEAKDIDAAAELLADDVVLTLIPPPPGLDGVFIGKDAVRGWYEELAAGNGRFEIVDVTVSGNRASSKLKFWDDSFAAMGIAPAEFDGVSIAQGGKLKSATWVFTEEFLARFETAMNKDTVRRYQTAWEQADLATLDEVLAEDFINHSQPLPPDREAMKEFAAEHRASFPTGKYTIQNLVAEGDLVFVYGHYQGTHDGEPFMGIPASGAEASFDYSILLRLENGKIVERWGTADDVMGLLVPLGYKLVPPEQ